MHWTPWAFSLALSSAGRSNAARIAMMAITTSNSIKVKAGPEVLDNSHGTQPRLWAWFILQHRYLIGSIPATSSRGRMRSICTARHAVLPEAQQPTNCTLPIPGSPGTHRAHRGDHRSEEHTSELQSP